MEYNEKQLDNIKYLYREIHKLYRRIRNNEDSSSAYNANGEFYFNYSNFKPEEIYLILSVRYSICGMVNEYKDYLSVLSDEFIEDELNKITWFDCTDYILKLTTLRCKLEKEIIRQENKIDFDLVDIREDNLIYDYTIVLFQIYLLNQRIIKKSLMLDDILALKDLNKDTLIEINRLVNESNTVIDMIQSGKSITKEIMKDWEMRAYYSRELYLALNEYSECYNMYIQKRETQQKPIFYSTSTHDI